MAYTGASPVYQNFPIDYFSGDGVTTAFNLSYPASAEGSILVTVNNQHVYANRYNVNNQSLVFIGYTPPAGTNNIEVLYLGLPALSEAVTGVTSVGLLSNLQGITVGNSPVITSGVMSLNGTLAVGSGGTGGTNYGQSQLMVGNGTAPFTSLGSTGATNQALVSNGSSVNPSWQNIVNSFSVGTTGLTANSTGSITLGGILNVPTGGTGVTTLANNRVLLGNGNNPVAQVNSTGSVGQVLTSTGNNPPIWSGPPVFSLVIPVSVGLTTTVSAGTVTLGGTLSIANGGTNATTINANSVVIGNLGGTGYTSISSTGTMGQMLTSAGPTSAPVWATPPTTGVPALIDLPVGAPVLGTIAGSAPPTFPVAYGTSITVDGTIIALMVSGSDVPNGVYRSLGTGGSPTTLSYWVRVS